jgi:RHS repeat-associated protein
VANEAGGLIGYQYNAEGQRVAKGTITQWSCNPATNGFTLTNEYIQDASGGQLTEFDGQGTWIHTNVSANGQLVATYDNDGQGVHFQLADWLGTRRMQTDYAGKPELECQSQPFGDSQICTAMASSAADATELHFTGKERDTESGNDYFGARYYASQMGRWMSPDQTGPNPSNPQALNLYRYGFNNPLRYTDPDGRYEHDVHHDLTYVLAYAAGYSEAQSQTIASADQGIDSPNSRTNPWNGYGFLGYGARKDWHFTNADRRNELLSQVDDEVSLGQYLHPFQDSYAHAGFGALFGHFFAGHGPDKTYTDPGKADTMSIGTYSALVTAGVQIGTEAGPVPLAEIMPFVQAFNRAKTDKDKDKQIQLIRQTVDQYRQDHGNHNQPQGTDGTGGPTPSGLGACSAQYQHC